MKEKISKIIFNKNGKGNISPKICLPIQWIKEMNIKENDKIKLSFINNKINIERGE